MSLRDDPAKGDGADGDEARYAREKRLFVLAAALMTGGLAFAGSLDRMSVGDERLVAGALVVGAWLVGILALHRLGRAGSARR